MGREYRRFSVSASVSRHNSPEDRLDDALFDYFHDKVEELARDPMYKKISLEIES
jgi:hypothetical protein